MKIRFFVSFIVFINFTGILSAQQDLVENSILFYNVENLFDTQDNLQTEDNGFTPDGDLHWTYKRMNSKLLNISKVILSASGWNPPDIVMFAEIENKIVLEKLIKDTPLKSVPYKIIHKESPDRRGIDVGLVYNPEHFFPIEYDYYPLVVNNDQLDSREILYVSGIFNETDTLHIFGNHWPSRYSGLLETKMLRKAASSLLRSKVDDLNRKHKTPKIVILGDFNDNPEDESMVETLLAKKVEQPIIEDQLYNLFFDLNRTDQGTLKYQSQWFIFDQIIVSGSLLSADSGIFTKPENATIITFPFLFEHDKKFGGSKPFRTYYGFLYNGGFSDHLPVLLKLNSAN